MGKCGDVASIHSFSGGQNVVDLRAQPRSIRGKLILVFVVAMIPAVGVSVYDRAVRCIGTWPSPTARLHAHGSLDHWSWLAWYAAALILGLTLLIVVGNRLAQPIRRLALAASALAVGDYRKRVAVTTGDELETLGRSFNELGESLERREAEMHEQAEMLSAMVEAARIASSSLDIKECGKAIAGLVCTHLGASDAAVYRKDTANGGVKSIGRRGERSTTAWRKLAARTAGSGEYLAISEHRGDSTGADARAGALLVGVPITLGTEPIGAFVARFEGSAYNDDLRSGGVKADVLTAFGVHAASTIDNAEVHSRSEQYGEVLADWVEHLSSVMQVTNAISPSLSLDETLRALACETASVLGADECVIYLPDRNGVLRVRACCASDWSLFSRISIEPGESESGIAFAEKRCVAQQDALKSRHSVTRKLSEMVGMQSLLSTPLLTDDRAIGVITIYCKQPRQFAPQEIRLLTSIGVHAAVIVRNASLYSRESSIAESLQKGLAPELKEECRGLRFAGRYIPALDEAMIGGDFYDVIPLPNGRVGVVMADVSGKGLSAAIHLATCKYMMRAFAYTCPDNPAAVLTSLNNALNCCGESSFFVTVFYAVIDPDNGVIDYSSAAHPAALLITEGGKVHTRLANTGTPAGSGYECSYQTSSVKVKPHDMLLLYTDGVIDATVDGQPLEVEGLHSMIFAVADLDPAGLVKHISDRTRGQGNSRQRDDIALLAVSFDQFSDDNAVTTGGADEADCCLEISAV